MFKVLVYGYTSWCKYTSVEKQLIFYPDANNQMVGEYMSWYEFGQLMGGN